jgi:histone-lysine N-methyltransferase SETMAR
MLHPPYSPNVAPSDYHFFGKLKESIRGTKFEGDDALITATKLWLRRAGPEFYRTGI